MAVRCLVYDYIPINTGGFESEKRKASCLAHTISKSKKIWLIGIIIISSH